MWSPHHLHTICKAILFSSVLYGWMIPTIGIGQLIQQWWPASQLSDTNWVVEEGPSNTSWDFITIDGVDAKDQENIEEDDDAPQEDNRLSSANSEKPNKDSSNTSAEVEQSESTVQSNELNKIDAPTLVSTQSTVSPAPVKSRFSKSLAINRTLTHPKKSRTRKQARRGKCSVKNPNISTDGKGWTHVPKNVVKHYSTHWKEANRLARLSWAKAPNGDRVGIRIRGISCQSPLKFTGLKRGDVVVSINGIAIQQDKDLLKVYSKLMFWRQMKVKVKRGGKMVTLKYKIAR